MKMQKMLLGCISDGVAASKVNEASGKGEMELM